MQRLEIVMMIKTYIFPVLLSAVCLMCVPSSMLAQDKKASNDLFSEIAKLPKEDYNDRRLVPVVPPKLNLRMLPLDKSGNPSAFKPMAKMSTAEELREELKRQRKSHAPFLKDLAPPLENKRIRVGLDTFDWRVETEADRLDFASTLAGRGKWKRLKIPHYEGPMGRAKTYYRTTFEVTQEMLDKGALFVHFNGVDYIAHVFVNGALVGSHEGLFAPFEFEITPNVRLGENVLLVQVVNDFIMLGNSSDKGFIHGVKNGEGDKIYACTGPNWDEPEVGWHACPPGMGIYQDVYIEARHRIHLHDIFVRPMSLDGKAEAWIEVFGCDQKPVPAKIELSIFGQNFPQTVFSDKLIKSHEVSNAGNTAKKGSNLLVRSGVNCYKIPITIPNPRLWNTQEPWLYQLQAKLLDKQGHVIDSAKRQFGMRTFRMEYVKKPKGRMYLNGKYIKLRGANTMGAFQQCVMRKDWKELIDDILLAKITHMNYIRLTQTPRQAEMYDYCDRLGLMLQTDLPLFGKVRRNQFCEVVRQAGEMEHLVRSHPSNIMVTYMNEPFP
ncbi:MAG: glycoside hydrolase family 2 protein, partial [Thermoguttaceae bacterium]